MFILMLKTKNTCFLMIYLRFNYEYIFIKKFYWYFWYLEREKNLDLWYWSPVSVYILFIDIRKWIIYQSDFLESENSKHINTAYFISIYNHCSIGY